MKRVRHILSAVMLVLCIFRPAPVCQAAMLDGDTGGINILKTNASGQPLEKAVFRIVREANREEAQDPSIQTESLTIGNETVDVIAQTFYGDRSMSGKLFRQISTDQEGRASMYGLSHGSYYLVEVKAPEGYNRIAVPIRVTVNKYSHLTEGDSVRDDDGVVIDNTIHIINLRYRIPDTGSSGQKRVKFAAVGVILSAGALFALNYRRRI